MEPLLKNLFIPDWILGLLLLSMVLMVVAKERYSYRFSLFSKLLTNTKYILVFNKKQGYAHPFQLIWQLIAIANLSLFFYLYRAHLADWCNKPELSQLSYGAIALGIGVCIVLKQLLQLIHGLLFNNLKIMQQIVFQKSSYYNYASTAFFITNLMTLFLFKNTAVVFFIGVSIVFIVSLVGWFLVFRNHQKYIANNIFYFILYLCALEIAPIIYMGSLLKN